MILDETIRKQTLDPTQSFIVQAPAGSGKTELLVKRFVTLLNLVDQPEQILAITFTRKAAQEMQVRVLDYLQKNNQSISNKNLLTQIQQQPDCLHIQTIDSFCQNLVRQVPFKSMILPAMQVGEDLESLYAQAAEQSLMYFLQDKPEQSFIDLLLYFDNDLPLLQKLLARMLTKRDQWLILGLHQGSQQEALLNLIQETWQNLIDASLSTLGTLIHTKDLVEVLRLAKLGCQYFSENYSTKTEPDWQYLAEISSVDETVITQDLPFWQALASFLLTKTGQWRKSITKKEGFPAASEARNAKQKQFYKENKQAFQELLHKLRNQASANNLLQKLQEILLLPSATILAQNTQQDALMKQVLSLLIHATAKLQLLFVDRGVVDYTQFLLAANALLENSLEDNNQLAEKLSYQIKHILVDEFQDTSVSQFYLLEQLMRSWDISMNVSLFLVGDPMQSIYKFRQADVSLFMRIWYQQLDLPVPVHPLRLQMNFRSTATLVNWANHLFSQLLPENANMDMAAVPHSPATAFHKTPAQTQTTNTIYCRGFHHIQQQQEYIVRLLQSKQDTTQHSTAILVRSRSHLFDLLNQLHQHQIHYQAVELASMADQLFIKDIMHLTKVIYNPTDRLSWFCLLRCPWIGLSLKHLYYIAHLDSQVWEAIQLIIQNPYQHPAIDKPALQRIKLVYKVLKQSLPMRFRQSWGELIMTAWDQLGGFINLSAQELEQADQVFYLLNQHGSYSALDLASIENTLEKTKQDQTHGIDKDKRNALQIMTIHKAKGLEFDRVIIPSLHMPSAHADPELLLFSPYHLIDKPGLLLALNQPNPLANSGSSLYGYMRYREKLQQSLEQDRLLYVAMTRAKQELHLLASLEGINDAKPKQNKSNKTATTTNSTNSIWKPTKGSFLAKLWPMLAEDFINSLPTQDEEQCI